MVLSKLCYISLSNECVSHLNLHPVNEVALTTLRGMLEALPKILQQGLLRTFLPMLQEKCGSMTSSAEVLRCRVVAIVLLCIRVSGNICCGARKGIVVWEGDYECDCIVKLDIFTHHFEGFIEQVIQAVDLSYKIRRFHSDREHAAVASDVIIYQEGMQSLEINEEERLDESPIDLDLSRIQNLTELYLVEVSVSGEEHLQHLKKLKTLYLDNVAGMDVSGVAQFVCKDVLPDLEQLYWGQPYLIQVKNGRVSWYEYDNIHGFVDLVAKTNCPCAVTCLQRLRWLGMIYLFPQPRHINIKVLQVLGVADEEKMLRELQGVTSLDVSTPKDFPDDTVEVTATFKVVNTISSTQVVMATLLNHVPNVSVSSIHYNRVCSWVPEFLTHTKSVLQFGEETTIFTYEKVSEVDVEAFLAVVESSKIKECMCIATT